MNPFINLLTRPSGRIKPNKPQVNFSEIILETKELVADMQKRKYLGLLESLPFVKVIEGFAWFTGDNTIEVEVEQYQGLKVIIATGASTSVPPIEGLDTIPYLTNISLFELEELPEPMVILGAGYIYYHALLHLVLLLFLLISYMVHQLIPYFRGINNYQKIVRN